MSTRGWVVLAIVIAMIAYAIYNDSHMDNCKVEHVPQIDGKAYVCR